MKLRDSLAENKSIRLQAEAETWQDAVKIGVDLLVAADVVEPRYYQAILDAVEQHGPYFVLAPGLAMPHGRPEEGVKKTGFALVTLKSRWSSTTKITIRWISSSPWRRLMPTLTRKWASCRSSTCLKMKPISTVYVPAVPSRKYWISLTAPTRQLKKELNMSLPMLQVALDNQTMDSAYETTRLIAEEVDIIEVGTILCVGEGVRAVRDLKALYPHKIVLADAKIADAGKILSRMCFEANADWVTVICCADINTAKGALDVAKEFNGDVQIELTGYWTWEQAQQWRDAGIGQVVYHRSRDAQAAGVAWGEADITAIKRLSDMGFKVTVTGGLALEDLPLFKGIPIHVFIAGRSIRDAASPVEAARQFKRSIAELWG